MKTIVNVVAVALFTAILLVCAVGPVIADCPSGSIAEWGGAGGDNLWSTEGNWVDDLEPSCQRLSVCLNLDDGDDLCEYDILANFGWHLTIFGEFPTFFTLKFTEDMVPDALDLQDYASLDVDVCVDAGATDLSGRVKIDVAAGVDCCLGNGDVEESASLDLTGQVKFQLWTISADQGNQSIKMILDDGGTLLADETRIKAEVNTGQTAQVAALQLKDGFIKTNDLRIWAGQTTDRRVSLDLDDNMTVRNKTTLGVFPGNTGEGGGRVVIDLGTGVTLDTGELYIAGPCILTVTGIDTTASPGQLQTSANEGASDNTCTCGPPPGC